MRRTVSAVVLLAACLPIAACQRATPAAQAASPAPAVTVTRTVSASPAASPTASATPSASPAAVTPAAPAPAARPHLTNASAVVSQYYQDITDHDYAAAWTLGGSNIAGTTYDRWVAGFDTTESITLGTISDFGATRVGAVLYATQTDGTVKTYDGTYTIADGVLVGASIRQTS